MGSASVRWLSHAFVPGTVMIRSARKQVRGNLDPRWPTMTAMTDRAALAPSQTDRKRLRAVTDEDIARAVADDPDAAAIPTPDEL